MGGREGESWGNELKGMGDVRTGAGTAGATRGSGGGGAWEGSRWRLREERS